MRKSSAKSGVLRMEDHCLERVRHLAADLAGSLAKMSVVISVVKKGFIVSFFFLFVCLVCCVGAKCVGRIN